MTVTLDASRISVADRANARRYSLRNVEFCAAINSGARFCIMFVQGTWLGDTLSTMSTSAAMYHARIVTAQGAVMPYPKFAEAAGIKFSPAINGHGKQISPGAPYTFELVKLLQWFYFHFGSAFRGYVDAESNSIAHKHAAQDKAMAQARGSIYFLAAWGTVLRVDDSRTNLQAWLYRGSSETEEDFQDLLLRSPHSIIRLLGTEAVAAEKDMFEGAADPFFQMQTVNKYLKVLDALEEIMHLASGWKPNLAETLSLIDEIVRMQKGSAQ